jgi:hypothetical protein
LLGCKRDCGGGHVPEIPVRSSYECIFPAIFCRVELKYSWRQPNLRIGENGQPGASGILVSLRKRIVEDGVILWDFRVRSWR